ncbi:MULTISPECIES: ABC transporter permease [Yersinia pseudotuberculosis complex]|uniref:Quaternary amine uptake ABC transporter (QAT) family, permease protein n=1 Tax=Yersinia pseudotuberculosis serotype O:1b (strain IP 31758) TaxID=349747 RepID=A0A0U1R0B8_YERP3|nr:MULTISPECIES: ABC transporter permease [Yersinia pseudotuberculosis complex]ABS48549.1 quaternary amine uptake ABC transporter (QAT) family, permease protein [Yersinia pseudotuberculosis IP 31758]AJK17176.1 binding--dependent transport system inner membrane component family protein [Yersinia pseudotuberculosis str. PA3606]MCE4111987.1 ABC transporter permease [Yersinia pseudotuberculosis]MCF1162223.1 ABC transporter permease [Yersinia pseudotuberculosis]RYC27940.1 ABC transporter permease [
MAVKNRVLLTLSILLVLAGAGLAFLSHAPNRLISGQGIMLISLITGPVLWLLAPILGLIIFAFLTPSIALYWLIILFAELLLLGLLLLAGATATQLAGGEESLVRTSLGGGFWLMSGVSLLIAIDSLSRVIAHPVWRSLAIALLMLPIIALLASGQLDQLSLMKEYVNRRDVFDDALWRHIQILLTTLVPAVVIGIPLGLLCFHSHRLQGAIFSTLNIIQTIPSIALFGLLIAPLSGLAAAIPWLAELGIGGIGLAPAIIALVLYALLPLVRNVVAGLEAVPDSVVESAKGMGMTRQQLFFRVQMPIAMPLILSGVRIIAVQTVGLAVVAALIGAGGLGAIVFQGLLSSALDLVLLGVIPVIAMAVIVDSLFKFIVIFMDISRR